MLAWFSLITVGALSAASSVYSIHSMTCDYLAEKKKNSHIQFFSPVLTTALTHLISAFTSAFQNPIFCLSALLLQFVTL